MQRGDIAVADKDFWILADGLIVEEWDQTGAAVATTYANNRLHLAILEHIHQIGGALAVRAGEKTQSLAHAESEFDSETETLKDHHCAINRLRVGWRAGRGNDGDGIARI